MARGLSPPHRAQTPCTNFADQAQPSQHPAKAGNRSASTRRSPPATPACIVSEPPASPPPPTSNPSARRPPKPQHHTRSSTSDMLPVAEIVRRLRIIRHSPQAERYARRIPSMNGVATAAGLSREFIHKIAEGTRVPSPRAAAALSDALTCGQNEGVGTGGCLRNDGSHGPGRG